MDKRVDYIELQDRTSVQAQFSSQDAVAVELAVQRYFADFPEAGYGTFEVKRVTSDNRLTVTLWRLASCD